MVKFLKKPIVIVLAIIIIGVVGAGFWFFGEEDAPSYDFIIAKRGNLTQEVSVTGYVKPAESVNLAFEKGGKAAQVYVNVGDNVIAGQTLVSLNVADLAAQLAEAESGVENAKAGLQKYEAVFEQENIKLAELKRGARPEEIQVQETKVENAKTSLEDAKNDLINKIKDAHTKSDDAIRNRIDQFISNPRSLSPQVIFPVHDFQLETDIEYERFLSEGLLNSWKLSLNALTVLSDLALYTNNAKKNLDQIKSLLDKSALAVNGLSASSNYSQTTIDGWRADVSTARTNVNTATVNLSTAEEKLRAAESTLSLEEKELVLKKAGTASEQIESQAAKVKEAEANISSQKANIKQEEANVANIQAQIAKAVIRAPISGIITKQDAKVGEIISANTPVVSLISEANFEIEANVPEADIAKVSVGNVSQITLDAYGDDVIFGAKVVAVDPAETVIDGVATYKVTFQFIKEDERIRPGMTANIDVSTDRRENVISVPARAVITKNGYKTVRILKGEEIKETEVKTGLRGSDGNIEITDGINEGDKVIIFVEEI
ncbi:MAG: hypothetical protein A2909_01835 [Candidatus Tagabacteria bacterium RIFCSPLOWO2_01_FULL_39_11]|uniref:CusB-like beta-barrel domain-containing protein n=1 Tax=Candidatus Tagabacteria bacterium RIFCSPLOWO2_01_FULL_39_11 TaxID=1802295 RepID=A0A1G2LRG4_9BACT|nr:MAG: hypothetical protein A2909_01835 [Candidatus Tagabacteria bacterium RIFCSPLOWO2_01_FULL_39_11]